MNNKLIPKYQSPWLRLVNLGTQIKGGFNKPPTTLAWEQQYINQSPLVKYNPSTPNVPGPTKVPKFNFKNLMGGLTPFAMYGVATTQDTLPDDYHMEWDNSKGRFVAIEHKKSEPIGAGVKSLVEKKSPVIISTNNYDNWWKPEYWAKIGLKQRGLSYNDYVKAFDEWFKTSKIDPKYHNLILKRNWDTYVAQGYNKPKVLTAAGLQADAIQEIELKENGVNTENTGTSKETNTANTENTETTVTTDLLTTPVNTYEQLVAANTAAFNNGINSAYWRRQYRKNFNRAVANGKLYNKENNTGTYVFDVNGMSALNIIDNYWTPGKGLTRKQMRKLRKEYNKPSSDKLESGRLSFYGFNPNKLTV